MNEKAAIVDCLSGKGRLLESDIVLSCGLPEEEVRTILRSNRHEFRKTGFLLLPSPFDFEWELTRIFIAEQCGRKTVPRVRGRVRW